MIAFKKPKTGFMFWVELCFLLFIFYVEVLTPSAQNDTLFGKRVFTDIISLERQTAVGGPLTQ